MANVKMYAEKRKNKVSNEIKTDNVPIIMSFSYEGARLMYPTGQKVDLKKWDHAKQRVKPQVSGALEINNSLEYLKEKTMKIYRDAKLQEIPVTNSYLKKMLKPNTSVKKSIPEYFDEFFIENERRFKPETKSKLKSNLKHLKRFSESTRFKLEFDAIDDLFLRKYLDYFYSLGHTNNTISKTIKNLKWFLNWCTEKGYNKNLQYRKFKVAEFKKVIISLSSDELDKIINCKLDNDRLNQVRDIFCFGCFTGLRFSDLRQLKSENIVGDFIKLRTIKTDSDVVIPILPITRNIIEKYKNYPMDTILPPISNQKMNEYIKEIAQIAGLDEEIVIYRYRGKERIENRFKKYEVVTSHVARKSFISIAFRMGIPTDIIKSISTHKSDEVFSLYNNISNEHKLEIMLSAFKKFKNNDE